MKTKIIPNLILKNLIISYMNNNDNNNTNTNDNNDNSNNSNNCNYK